MSLFDDERVIEAAVNEIAPVLDIRCGQCAGTGSDLRSNLDCTPCKATGYRQGTAWVVDTAREVAHDTLNAALAALPREELIEKTMEAVAAEFSACSNASAERILVAIGLIPEHDTATEDKP